MLEHFNKASTNQGLAEIDWQEWEGKIHTPDVVNKIKDMYDQFMESEYNVEAAVQQVNHESEKIKQLEIASTYNFTLYFIKFIEHLHFIETLRNIGDIAEMSNMEMLSLNQGIEMLHSTEMELGNIAPESYIENGVYTRMLTQFSWGSRYNPPFVHSQDALNSVVSTLAKLGK